MSLNINIDTKSKKALVTFSVEIDMAHALRQEQCKAHVRVLKGDRQVAQCETLAEATDKHAGDDHTFVEVPEGVRYCMAEKDILDHAVQEAHRQFTAAVTAHSMTDAMIAEEKRKKIEELEAHVSKRPVVRMK